MSWKLVRFFGPLYIEMYDQIGRHTLLNSINSSGKSALFHDDIVQANYLPRGSVFTFKQGPMTAVRKDTSVANLRNPPVRVALS